MLPTAHISHQAAGRLRIKIPAEKGNQAYFASLKDRFSSFPGVQKIEVNPLTGSVLVLHTLDLKEVDFKMISEYTEQSRLFRFSSSNQSNGNPFAGSVSKTVVASFKDVNKKVEQFTKGEVDLPTLAFVGLMGFGLFDLVRGKSGAPTWHVAFWYALNIFLINQLNKNKYKAPEVKQDV